VKAKALFIAQKTAEKENTNTTETSMTKSAEDMTGDDKEPDQVTKETAVTNNQAPAGTGQLVDTAEPEQAHVETNDTAIDLASDDPLLEPTAISPKEWRYLHNQWLQSVMRAAMGNTAHPEIPNLADYKYKKRDEPDYEIEVEPPRVYVSCYDLRIKVAAGENQVELFHQAFCKWYLKVKEADQQAAIYPWRGKDRDEEALLVENPTDIPTSLPLLKKFVNKLFLRTMGGNYYIQVLLGTDVDLDMVMQTIGWWLKSTKQGMWKAPLQFAKNTVCVRWLLYSADKYNCKALCRDIWQLTGIQVALCYG